MEDEHEEKPRRHVSPGRTDKGKLARKIARMVAHAERHPHDAASAAHRAKLEAKL